MTTRNLAIAAIILWVASAAFLGFKFFKGDTYVAKDGREAVVLSEGERTFVLGEMRGMLAGVQDILAAANANDMAALKAAARKIGLAEAQGGEPAAIMLKLPLAFKQLGMATHEGFDQVALAAEQGPQAALDALEDNLAKCVACHAAYQFSTGR